MRALKILLCTLILFISFNVPASASSLMDNLVPEDKAKSGKVEQQYKEYPVSRYNMDTYIEDDSFNDFMPWGWDEGLGKELAQTKSDAISIVWNWNILYSSIIGKFVEEVFSLDLLSMLSHEIATVIQKIAGFGPGGFKSSGIWPYILTSMIMIVGIWAMYTGIVKRQTSRVWSGIFSTILIMFLALTFFAKADTILNMFNDSSNKISNAALSGAVSAIDPDANYTGEEGYIVMRNIMFQLMIYQPYLYGQYGTADEAKIESEWNKDGKRVDYLLKHGDFTEERKDAVKYEAEDMKNDMLKPEALNDRFILVLMVTIFNGVLGLMVSLLAGSSVLYQFFVIVFALITPVAFLMSLIPAYSYNAFRLLGKLIFCFLMKIALTMLIVIAFGFSSLISNALAAEQGYVVLMILNIVLIIAIWVKRSDIFSILTSPTTANLSQSLGQSLTDYKKIYAKTRKYTNKVTAPALKPSAPLAERTGYNKLKVNPGVGAYNAVRDGGKYKESGKANSANGFANRHRKAPSTAKSKVENSPSQATQSAFKDRAKLNKAGSNDKANHSPTTRKAERPANTPPPIDRNDASLQETTKKGGWAYNTKQNPVEMKAPPLKDRLKDRNASKK